MTNPVSGILHGDAQTFANRKEQVGLGGANVYEAEIMMYGTYGNVARNVNFQLGNDYVNNSEFITDSDDNENILYKLEGENSFLELDWDTGHYNIKDSDGVAKDMGLVTDKGESVATYFSMGRNSINAVTLQQGSGVEFQSTVMDLTSKGFNSKWGGTLSIFNIDFAKSSWQDMDNILTGIDTDYSDNQEDLAMIEAINEAKQILTPQEYGAIFESGLSNTEMLEAYKTLLKERCLKVETKE